MRIWRVGCHAPGRPDSPSPKHIYNYAPGGVPNYCCWSANPRGCFLGSSFWQRVCLLSSLTPWAPSNRGLVGQELETYMAGMAFNLAILQYDAQQREV
eukprot:1023530-Pelagomonas_calceolata.AAC.2